MTKARWVLHYYDGKQLGKETGEEDSFDKAVTAMQARAKIVDKVLYMKIEEGDFLK